MELESGPGPAHCSRSLSDLDLYRVQNVNVVVEPEVSSSSESDSDDVEVSQEENVNMNNDPDNEEIRIREFCDTFKRKRNEFGYALKDVEEDLYNKFGIRLWASLISNFENQKESLKQMIKHEEILTRWVNAVEGEGTVRANKRKAKSVEKKIEKIPKIRATPEQRQGLEAVFLQQDRIKGEELTNLATNLGMEERSVSNWFNNRRQKRSRELKVDDNEDNENDEVESSGSSAISDEESDGDADALSQDEIEIKRRTNEFADFFKKRRNELGYVLQRVERSIQEMFGIRFGYHQISNFENKKESLKMMVKHEELLTRWLNAVEVKNKRKARAVQVKVQKKVIKPRATIEQRHALEAAFLQNDRVSGEELTNLATNLGMEEKSVSNWFNNRRQKRSRELKVDDNEDNENDEVESSGSSSDDESDGDGDALSQDEIEIKRRTNEFADFFKKRRNELGYVLQSVERSIQEMFGIRFWYHQISQFENKTESLNMMVKHEEILTRWLNAVEVKNKRKARAVQVKVQKKVIKPRATIEQRQALEAAFLQNDRVSGEEITNLATNLGMEEKSVRNWFNNRKQKIARELKEVNDGEENPSN